MASTVAESAMSSRERVKAAISGKPVDRVPVMYWLNPHMATRLMCEYRSPSPAIQRYAARCIWNRFTRRGEQNSDEISRALPFFLYEYGNSEYPLRLGADIALLSAGAWTEGKRIKRMIYRENGGLRFLDPFGNTRALGGVYAEIIDWPIKSIADLAPYRLPNLSDTSKIESFREKHPDVFILAQVPGPQQLIADGLMSMERFMYALYDHPEEMQLFFRRVGDWCVDIARTSIEAGADAVFIEDDYGYTERTLLSMAMWTEFTLPQLGRIVNTAHEQGSLAILHSCGYQMPFLDHYVEIEIDMLQSFQPKAGNDLAAAVSRHGNRLAFATGIDTQCGETMSPGDFAAQIAENERIGRQHGRFVLAMTHMMQYTMPAENYRAIFDTVGSLQRQESRLAS